MKRYDSYKDSGVEWIGKVPNGWSIQRISSLYEARNTKVSENDFPALSVTLQGIVPQLDHAAKSQDTDNRKLVLKGDFVINSRSDRRGSCGVSGYDGSVTLISNVLMPKDITKTNPDFYYYLFKSEGFADEYYKAGQGIVDDLWTTNWSRMKNILVPVPDLETQTNIAAYLDQKTSQIDFLIEKTERTIALLEEYRKSVISEAVTKGLDSNIFMKDSGVEWIGEIPRAWKVTKIKFSCVLSGRIGWQGLTSDEYVEEGPYLITGINFSNGRVDWSSCVHITEDRWKEADKVQIVNNDLLITKDGTVGKVAIVDSLLGKASLNSGVLVIRPIVSLDKRYLFYVLQSEIFWGWFSEINAGNSTIIHLYQKSFEQFSYPLPSLAEQGFIGDCLDKQTSQIDSLIEKKRQVVEKLQEYRKSLISECVTGEIKVSGVWAS